jgi:hypothetical protein
MVAIAAIVVEQDCRTVSLSHKQVSAV